MGEEIEKKYYCATCKQSLPISSFNKNRSNLKGRLKGYSKKCKNCGKSAKFRYCSNGCLRDFWNKNDYHLNKKRKWWEKKIEVIKKLGGKCKKCGINDIRVLDINHIDRNKKERPKKLHYTQWNRMREWENNLGNLELLCANCHRIHTWKQMGYGK